MLSAVHPVPAGDVRLDQAFASTAAAGSASVYVGRSEGAISALRLNDAAPERRRVPDKLVSMVSRRHAELVVVSGQLQLVAMQAVNGTYVNDQRIEAGSRRVLQENDVISFGGPSTIVIKGQPLPNPWVWRVRQLHEFLAAYVPPHQGPPPTAHVAAAVAAGCLHPAGSGVAREMYSFSPTGSTARQQLEAPQPQMEVQAEPQSQPSVGHVLAPLAGEEGSADRGGRAQTGGQAALQAGPSGELAPVSSPMSEPRPPPPAGLPAAALAPGAIVPAAPLAAAAAAVVAAQSVEGEEEEGEESADSAEVAGLATAQAELALQPAGAGPEQQLQQLLQSVPPRRRQALPPGTLVASDETYLPYAGESDEWGAEQAGGSGGGSGQEPDPWLAAAGGAAAVAAAAIDAPLRRALQGAAQPSLRPPPALQLEAPAPPPPAAAAQPELIDLTADSPVSQQQQQLQRQQGGGARGREFVDLLNSSASSSPTKRRHAAAQQGEQGTKRARPSPEARLPRTAGPGGGAAAAAGGAGNAEAAGPSAAAAAAAAGGGGGTLGAGPSSDVNEKLQQEMVCPICQGLLVVAHAMVPCGHWFCGECLAGWLGNRRKDCPSCRKESTAAPLRQHAIDNMVDLVAKALPAEDLEDRQQRLHGWEKKKEQLERQLAAPWQRGAGGAGRLGDGGGLLSAIAASILGGGGLGFGAPPAALLGRGGAGEGVGLGLEVPPWGGAGARGRRTPAVVARHAPAAMAALPTYEFRVEVSPQHSTSRCAACTQAIGELTTRIGMRPQGYSRRGGGEGGWRWHHLQCLPAAHWREARVNGISNLRGIPAPEQSRVRQHLQLVPRER